MRCLMLLCSFSAVLLLPNFASAQCAGTEEALAPCHCLTMLPFPPVEEECVTIAHYVNGEQKQIGPLEEPICISNGEDELCLGEEEVAFNDDGSISNRAS